MLRKRDVCNPADDDIEFVTLEGLLKSPIWLKFYPCFPRFDLFKSAYTLVGYVTFKKIKSALQGSNFNEKAEMATVLWNKRNDTDRFSQKWKATDVKNRFFR